MKLLILLGIVVCTAYANDIILTEDDLMNTCTKTCEDAWTLYNWQTCKTVSGCRTSSHGWARGFVRCDYCKCNCEPKVKQKMEYISTTYKNIDEPDLYGTCTGTCDKRGLVRTNYQGCTEIRDCSEQSSGWLRGFVMCDHCVCKCLQIRDANKHTVSNVKYDLNQLSYTTNKQLLVVATTDVINRGSTTQKAKRAFAITYETSSSWSSSRGIEIGVSVEMSAKVPLLSEFKTTLSTTTSFSYEWGSSKSESKSDTIEAEISVGGRKKKTVKITGEKSVVDIPYTATLTTSFKDGGANEVKSINGVYHGVAVNNFQVEYESETPLRKRDVNDGADELVWHDHK